MLPPVDDPRWRAIVTGAVPFTPTPMSARMLLTRLTASVQEDPSLANVGRRAAELHAFCQKFEKLVAGDLTRLASAAK